MKSKAFWIAKDDKTRSCWPNDVFAFVCKPTQDWEGTYEKQGEETFLFDITEMDTEGIIDVADGECVRVEIVALITERDAATDAAEIERLRGLIKRIGGEAEAGMMMLRQTQDPQMTRTCFNAIANLAEEALREGGEDGDGQGEN